MNPPSFTANPRHWITSSSGAPRHESNLTVVWVRIRAHNTVGVKRGDTARVRNRIKVNDRARVRVKAKVRVRGRARSGLELQILWSVWVSRAHDQAG